MKNSRIKSGSGFLFFLSMFHFSLACWGVEVGTFEVRTGPPPQASYIEATPGVLRRMQPDFPQFYIWRKVYEKGGSDPFRLFLLQKNGSLIQVAGNKDRFQEITRPNDTSKLRKKNLNGKAITIFPIDPSRMELKYVDGLYGGPVTCTVDVPGKESVGCFGLIGWHPREGYLYLWTSETVGENEKSFYQFDIWRKEFTFIGKGFVGEPRFNMDGRWLVWASVDKSVDSGRQIHVYDTQGNIDYTLTNDRSDNVFYKWAQDYSGGIDEQVNEVIEEGKEYLLRRKYSRAVKKYQEAIALYPRSDVAFGLMGYCYFKQGDESDALTALRKSIDLNPRNYLSRYNLVLALWAGGQKQDSMEELKTLLKVQRQYQASLKKDPQFSEIIQSKEYQQIFQKQKN